MAELELPQSFAEAPKLGAATVSSLPLINTGSFSRKGTLSAPNAELDLQRPLDESHTGSARPRARVHPRSARARNWTRRRRAVVGAHAQSFGQQWTLSGQHVAFGAGQQPQPPEEVGQQVCPSWHVAPPPQSTVKSWALATARVAKRRRATARGRPQRSARRGQAAAPPTGDGYRTTTSTERTFHHFRGHDWKTGRLNSSSEFCVAFAVRQQPPSRTFPTAPPPTHVTPLLSATGWPGVAPNLEHRVRPSVAACAPLPPAAVHLPPPNKAPTYPPAQAAFAWPVAADPTRGLRRQVMSAAQAGHRDWQYQCPGSCGRGHQTRGVGGAGWAGGASRTS